MSLKDIFTDDFKELIFMKKGSLTALTSTAILLTSLIPLTANAEETADTNFQLHEEYTFEEFLDLSGDEVCEISEQLYSYNNIPNEIFDPIQLRFTVDLELLNEFKGGTDLAPLCRDMGFPEDMLVFIKEGGSNNEFQYSADSYINFESDIFSEYGDYEYIMKDSELQHEIYRKAIAWFAFHSSRPSPPEPAMVGWASASAVKGDVDSDDSVTISDASAALSLYARRSSELDISDFTEDQLDCADVDKNGTVDLTDASAILSYYAKNGAGIKTYWATVLTEIAPISE